MRTSHRLADRAYIEDAARRYDTAIAAAFRRALGVGMDKKPPRKKRRRRRHHSGSQPTHAELEECRKQKHGVVWHDGQ